MADVADKAQALEEIAREEGIKRVRVALGDADCAREIEMRDCVDCGEEIPLERMIAVPKAVRCTPCEAEHEKAGRAL